MVALAVLMPIVASMGGNAGTQTMTVTVRALAMRELDHFKMCRLIVREMLVGLLNGGIFAVLIGVVATLWFDNLQLGLVIGIAMIVNMIAAGTAGILIPLGLNRLKIDPADRLLGVRDDGHRCRWFLCLPRTCGALVRRLRRDAMKLIFANRNYSSWSLRAWLVLKHFGIPFEEELVLLNGEGWKENIRHKSPQAVPCWSTATSSSPRPSPSSSISTKVPGQGHLAASRVERALARSAAAEMHGGFAALRNAAPMNLRASHPGKVDLDASPRSARSRRCGATCSIAPAGRTCSAIHCAADAMYAPVATRIRTYELPASDVAQSMSRRSTRCPRSRSGSPRRQGTWIVEQDEIDIMRERAAVAMMHMIKLCVGVATLEELEAYRAERRTGGAADYGEDVHVHRTRDPAQAGRDLEGQGSIYWVISASSAAASRSCGSPRRSTSRAADLLRHHHGAGHGAGHVPRPRSPFQGWRYLEPKDAPPDVETFSDAGEAGMVADLMRLGLL